MRVSYASSEIIVEIIDITEKCSPGFVLITQVTAHRRDKWRFGTVTSHHSQMSGE